MASSSRFTSQTLRAGAVVLLLAAAACATHRPMPYKSASSSRSSCLLLIENHGISDVHVYAVVGQGQRVRLGRVNALETIRMRLPASLVGARTVRLEAVPTLLGDPYTSDPVLIEEGTEIVWRLENDLGISTLFVR